MFCKIYEIVPCTALEGVVGGEGGMAFDLVIKVTGKECMIPVTKMDFVIIYEFLFLHPFRLVQHCFQILVMTMFRLMQLPFSFDDISFQIFLLLFLLLCLLYFRWPYIGSFACFDLDGVRPPPRPVPAMLPKGITSLPNT